MLSLWADFLPRVLFVVFCNVGTVNTLVISISSFLLATAPSGLSTSRISTATTEPGSTASVAEETLNDGNLTTYLEEGAEYHPTKTSDATAVGPKTTKNGTSGYYRRRSLTNYIQCELSRSSRESGVKSESISLNVITSSSMNGSPVFVTSYVGSTILFATLSSSEMSPSASSSTPSATSPLPTIESNLRHHQRTVVGRAVGGAVGGGLFITALALLLYKLVRRARYRGQPPSHQHRSVHRTKARDSKDISLTIVPFSALSPTQDALYVNSSLRPWTSSINRTSKEKIATTPISAPFVPPPPRTSLPEAPPTPERLPSHERNCPSKFVEQLMVNSTDLDVLVAIAKAARKQHSESEPLDNLEHSSVGTFIRTRSP
ncbi:hypothetical protein GYMLUDRAFT_533945 [Collybiopsis luxurians FD-317 M1]|nr:hypothetical protein GYMLUDRAFT_533945 [Collybiopsis luxurians FD-317 M1]